MSGQTSASSMPSGRDCFNARMVNGYSSVDADTVRVTVGARNDYDLKISGPGCSNVTWSNRVALTTNASTSWICVGDAPVQGRIGFQDSALGPTSCNINSVSRVPPKAPPA
jgi:hypothetical protein